MLSFRYALLAVLLATGCNVFDPELYMRAEMDAGMPGPDTGPADPPLATQDSCSGMAPLVEPSTTNRMLDTTALGDDISMLSSCTGNDALGNDGFFTVQMEIGQKWHVHVRANGATDRNPAVYVLTGSCDERTCQPGDAIDECGVGADEHLTFVARTAGRHVIGVDDRVAGGSVYRVLVAQPVCGNGGEPEHSETCDDGNTDPGDGCDVLCRAELTTAAATEDEPNDEWTSANIVMPDGTGTLTVSGRIGGRCDFDAFGLEVPEGQSIRATILDAAGAACPMTAPALKLTMIRPDGRTIQGSVDTPGPCPAIDATHSFAQGLGEGKWFVRLSTVEGAPTFDYRIRFEIVP